MSSGTPPSAVLAGRRATVPGRRKNGPRWGGPVNDRDWPWSPVVIARACVRAFIVVRRNSLWSSAARATRRRPDTPAMNDGAAAELNRWRLRILN